MKRKKRWVLIFSITIFFIIVPLPYIRAEILTKLHGNEFKELYMETGWLNQIDYLKVNKYSRKSAEVYYVGNNHQAVFIYYFVFDNGWELSDWKCIWSKKGNADEFTWPYYR